MRRQAPLEHDATQTDANVATEHAQEIDALEPSESRPFSRGRNAPWLSEGKIKPSPTRPTMGHSTRTHTAELKVTVIISANDKASRVNPMLTSRWVGW